LPCDHLEKDIVLANHAPLLPPIQTVDAALLSAIKKVDNLGRYLRSEWGLSKGDRIHELKF
jgi:hypothetical protein